MTLPGSIFGSLSTRSTRGTGMVAVAAVLFEPMACGSTVVGEPGATHGGRGGGSSSHGSIGGEAGHGAGGASTQSTTSSSTVGTGGEQGCVDGGTCPGPAGCAGSGDAYWSSVIALIPCTSSITDVSGKSVVAIHNMPAVSSVPAGAPGGASCSLGNAGSYGTANGFTVALPAALGQGDFTVELSVFQSDWFDSMDAHSDILITATAYPPSATVGFPSFSSDYLQTAVAFSGGGSVYVDSGSALHVWESYAASRVAGTLYLFRNGTLLTSFPNANDYSDTSFHVSHQANGPYNAVMGSIGQIRVTRAGRYTSSYQVCSGGFAESE